MQPGVRSHVDAIVQRHAGPLDLSTVTERPSAHHRFMGLTYVICADSQAQIAALFEALEAPLPQVVLVLLALRRLPHGRCAECVSVC